MLTVISAPVAKDIIRHVGGGATLAKMLGVSRQRVHQWTKRGISHRAILEHYDVILALHTKVREKRK